MSDYTEHGAVPVDDAVADDPPTIGEVMANRESAAARSTKEVVEDHLRRRLVGDLEGDLARNYSEDVAVLSAVGIHRGHDGVRHLADILHTYLPDRGYQYRQVLCSGEVGMLQWTAEGPNIDVDDGADSYLVRDGRIVAQTIHYSVGRGRSASTTT